MAAEVPWWSNLVAILGTAVVSVLGTVYFIKGSMGPAVKGPPGIGALLKETMLYLPHIMLLFGVLADMFTMQGVYSIPSLVGLLSMPVSGFLMKYFWMGVGDTVRYIVELIGMRKVGAVVTTTTTTTKSSNPFVPDEPVATRTRSKGTAALPAAATKKGGAPIVTSYDGCTVQGFSGLQSPYAPQTLVVTATVFWYYIIDLIVNKGAGSAAMSLGVFLAFYVAQMFLVGDCSVEGATVQVSRWLKGVIAMSEGALYGGTAFAVVSSYYPTKLPTAVLPMFAPVDPADLIPSPDGSGTLVNPLTGIKYRMINGIPVPDTCGAGDSPSGESSFPGVCPSETTAAPAATGVVTAPA